MSFITKITTTTTTLAVPNATMSFIRSGINSTYPVDVSSVVVGIGGTGFSINFSGSSNFTPIKYKIKIAASGIALFSTVNTVGITNVSDTTGGDPLTNFISGSTVQSTTTLVGIVKNIMGDFYTEQPVQNGMEIRLYVDQVNDNNYILNDTLTYYVNP